MKGAMYYVKDDKSKYHNDILTRGHCSILSTLFCVHVCIYIGFYNFSVS